MSDPTIIPLKTDPLATPKLEMPELSPVQMSGSGRTVGQAAQASRDLANIYNMAKASGLKASDPIVTAHGVKMLNDLGLVDVNPDNFIQTVNDLMGGVDGHYKLDASVAHKEVRNFYELQKSGDDATYRVFDALSKGIAPDPIDLKTLKDVNKKLEDVNQFPLSDFIMKSFSTLSTPFQAVGELVTTGGVKSALASTQRLMPEVRRLALDVLDPEKIVAQTSIQTAHMVSGLEQKGLMESLSAGAVVGTGYGVASTASPLTSPITVPLSILAGIGTGFVAHTTLQGQRLSAGYSLIQGMEDEYISKMPFETQLLLANINGALESAGDLVGEAFIPGVSVASKAISKKIIGDSLSSAIKRSLVNGTYKDIWKSVPKDIAKSTAAEVVGEVSTQILQNAMNEAFSIAVSHKDVTPETLPAILDGIENAAMAALYSSFGISGPTGLLSGAGQSLAKAQSDRYHKTEKPSTSQTIASMKPSDTSTPDQAVAAEDVAVTDAAPDVSNIIFSAIVSEGDSTSDVPIHTSQAEVATKATSSSIFATKSDVVDGVKKAFGDGTTANTIIDVINTGKLPDSAIVAKFKESGVDLEAIVDDVVPYLGKTGDKPFFKEALNDLGINTTKLSKVVNVKLDKTKTFIATDGSKSQIEQARKGGFKAIVWPDGSQWSGLVLEPDVVQVQPEVSNITETTTSDVSGGEILQAKEAIQQTPQPQTYRLNNKEINKYGRQIRENLVKAGLDPEKATGLSNLFKQMEHSTYAALQRLAQIPVTTDPSLGKPSGGKMRWAKYNRTGPSDTIGAIFLAPNPRPLDVLHEYIHAFFAAAPEAVNQEIKRVYGFHPVEDYNTPKWQTGNEVLVDDIIKYINDGQAKTPALKQIFDSIVQWLREVINEYLDGRPQYQRSNAEVKGFLDNLFGGKFLDAEVPSSQSLDTDTSVLFSESGFDLATVKSMIQNNDTHLVPTRVLEAFQSDPEVHQALSGRIMDLEGTKDFFTQEEGKLSKIYEDSDMDTRKKMMEEFGDLLMPSTWDNHFKKLMSDDSKLVQMAKVVARHIEHGINNAETLLTYSKSFTDIKRLRRMVERNPTQFRIDYWDAMTLEGSVIHGVASAFQADHTNTVNAQKKMAEDFVENDPNYEPETEIKDLKQSLRKADAEIAQQSIKIVELEDRLKKMRRSKNAKIKVLETDLNARIGVEKRKMAAMLKSKKPLNKVMEKLAVESGNGIYHKFADAIDFIASFSTKYRPYAVSGRVKSSISKIMDLSNKYNLGLDQAVLEELYAKNPKDLTIGDATTLIAYKKVLRDAGRQYRIDQIAEHNREVAKWDAQMLRQMINSKKIKSPEGMMQVILMTEQNKMLIKSGIPQEAIIMLMAEGNEIGDIKQARDKFNKDLKQRLADEYDDMETKPKISKRQYVKEGFDKAGIHKLTDKEIDQQISDIDTGKIEGFLSYQWPQAGTSAGKARERGVGRNIADVIFDAYRRFDLPSDQMFEVLDGMDENGPFFRLLYGEVSGHGETKGFLPDHYRDVMKATRDFVAFITSKGIKKEDLGKKIYYKIDSGEIVDGKGLKFHSVNKLEKMGISFILVEDAMEMYASTKSRRKLSHIIYGNNININVVDALSNSLDQKYKDVADWITEYYASVEEEMREAYELHTGEKYQSDIDPYTPIISMVSDLQKEVDMMQAGGAIGADIANPGATHERKDINPAHQVELKLGLVSNFFKHIEKVSKYTKGIKTMDIIRDVMGFGKSAGQKLKLSMMQDYMGNSNLRYIKRYYSAIMNDSTLGNEEMNGIMRHVLNFASNLVVSVLAAKVITAATQLLSLPLAAGFAHNKTATLFRMFAWTGRYMIDYVNVFQKGGRKAQIEQVYNEAPSIWARNIDYMYRDFNSFRDGSIERGRKSVIKATMSFFRMFDVATSAAIYKAIVYDQTEYDIAQAKKAGKSEKEIGAMQADIVTRGVNAGVHAIHRTQPNSDIVSTPESQRGYGKMLRPFLSFMSGVFKVANQLVNQAFGTKLKTIFSKKAVGKKKWEAVAFMSFTIAAFALTQYMDFVMKSWRLPEGDDDWDRIKSDSLSMLGLAGRVTADAWDASNGKFRTSRSTPVLFTKVDKSFKDFGKAVSDPSPETSLNLAMDGLSFYGMATAEAQNLGFALTELEGVDQARVILGGRK